MSHEDGQDELLHSDLHQKVRRSSSDHLLPSETSGRSEVDSHGGADVPGIRVAHGHKLHRPNHGNLELFEMRASGV